MPINGRPKNIAVDLDGTLAHYEKYDGIHPGAPIPRMVDRVRQWLDDGEKVYIFTARASHPEFDYKARIAITDWCVEHLGRALPITCTKEWYFDEFWDDKSWAVESNTGAALGWDDDGMPVERR